MEVKFTLKHSSNDVTFHEITVDVPDNHPYASLRIGDAVECEVKSLNLIYDCFVVEKDTRIDTFQKIWSIEYVLGFTRKIL